VRTPTAAVGMLVTGTCARTHVMALTTQ